MVVQHAHVTTYTYSSLGRVLTATTPESGTTTYTYYDSGLLRRKTDARGKWSEASYDTLNRITGRTYSDATPAVTYTYYVNELYPFLQNGRLRSISTSASTTLYVYNMRGDVISSSQTTDGDTRCFNYEWYTGGSLKSVTYPS